ncbi:AbrB/MazE/SpoVT family DNA-binding domain-containing protein [Bradyrhizobium sp. 25ACV]
MKVFKWDDDLAAVLPQELIDRLTLKEGGELEIVATRGSAAAAEIKDAGDGPSEEKIRRVELWHPTACRNPLISLAPSTVHGVVFDI